ncbi:hypothetical protein EIP91_003190 [Steccherinum ochraceum]|uniref:F-box domain-containing protein n=1 Tax=Steccherinum ochraceum TaxID=92696 RepID=A0A4V2MXX6_9APHY|nr:hypothetical protein EIP91_003190 [Steccherinum ochraceum]
MSMTAPYPPPTLSPGKENGSLGLPMELLTEIFVLSSDDNEDDSWSHLQPLMLVCRYWRDAAFGSPFLWTNFRIRHDIPLSTVHIQLARAVSIPLNVTIDFHTSPTQSSARSLPSFAASAVSEPPSRVRRPYLGIVPSKLPICETCESSSPGSSERLTFSGARYRTIFPYFRPTFRSLAITLEEAEDWIPDCYTSPFEFLQALQGMPSLGELSVVGLFQPGVISVLNNHALPKVTLPSLQRIFLHCHGQAMADMVHSLVLPARAFLSPSPSPAFIAGGFSFSSLTCPERSKFSTVFAAFTSKLVGVGIIQEGSDVLPVTDELRVRLDQEDVVDIQASHETKPFFSYKHRAIRGPDMLAQVTEHVCGHAPLPFRAGVRALSLCSPHQRCTTASASLLHAFPYLERLELDNCPGMFEQLVHTNEGGQGIALPFPDVQASPLQALSVTRVAFSQDVQFVAWLRSRQDAGLPLRALKIRSCENLTQAVVDGFRAHVDDVDWDGV